MRTSLNEIKKAEDYISGSLAPEDHLLFRAKMIVDPILKLNVLAQRKIYSFVKLYGRKQMRSEIELVHTKIFTDPNQSTFRKQIERLFLKP